MSVLSAAHFHNEPAAYAFVEARVWANGVTCPHCGNVDETKIGKLAGSSTRIGVRKCVNAGVKMHRRAGVKMPQAATSLGAS